MKTTKLILKGVLFYTTLLSIVFLMCANYSSTVGLLIHGAISAILAYIGYLTISDEEYNKLLFANFFNKLFNKLNS